MANDKTKSEALEWLVRKSVESAHKMGNYTSETKIREHCIKIADLANKRSDTGENKKRRK